MPTNRNQGTCECYDSVCRVHRGRLWCDRAATTIVHQIKAFDMSGLQMCYACAQDAVECGRYAIEPYEPDFEELVGGE